MFVCIVLLIAFLSFSVWHRGFDVYRRLVVVDEHGVVVSLQLIVLCLEVDFGDCLVAFDDE